MALINHEQHFFREIIQQTIRRCAFFPTIEITAVVLHSGAVTELVQHLQIVLHTLLDTLSIQLFTNTGEVLYLFRQIRFDLLFGGSNPFSTR